MRTLLLALLLAAPVCADTLRVSGSRAYTGNEMVKQVIVEVKVTNYGDKPVENAIVEVVCTPEHPGTTVVTPTAPSMPDLMSPTHIEKIVGPLKAGESRTIQVYTPFFSANHFDQNGSAEGHFFADLSIANNPRAADSRIRYKVNFEY